ncbi:AMP-binding protein [Magnetospirillum sp. UT-4]|uniref:AMP-binding protein n=1 Tax=Magnetospirillum sp. UT-4 TaxID=2681467 RepID=UPI0013812A6C
MAAPASVIPLARLALADRPPGQAVAVGAGLGGDGLDWARFRAEVGGTAAALSGCRRGLLCCRDGWRFAVGLFGLLAAGAEVALPPNDRPDTLARLAGECDRVVDDDFGAAPGAWSGVIDPGLAIAFHTSGSTGEPKRVLRGLAALDGEIAALQALWGARLAGAPALSMVPLHHAFGLVFGLLWPLAAGRAVFRRRCDAPEEALRQELAGAVVVSSPAHLTRLDGLAPLAPESRPRLVLSAGAPLPEAAAADARALFGAPVAEIYGSTETGAIATRPRDGGDPAWIPLPGYRVEATAEGLLRLHAPGGTAELADRIAVEDDGFRLLGRADRIVKIEGKRVALDEVERDLATLAEVAEARVLLLDGPVPTLAAVVVPSATGAETLAAEGAFRFGRRLRRRLSARLDFASLPRRWRFVAALPATALGKQTSAALAVLFEEPAP